MTADTKVVLLALLNAALLTAGVGFQKLNGVRGGNPVTGPWILAAFLCMAPTFFVGNVAMGIGRVSLFVPVTAVAYISIALMSWACFGEALVPRQMAGLVLLVLGVALVAWKPA